MSKTVSLDLAKQIHAAAKEKGVEWRPVPEHEGRYEVSSCGQVRRLPEELLKRGHHNQKSVWWSGGVLRQANTSSGYKQVDLCSHGGRRTHRVHQLVAKAFLLNPENKPNVNHKNFDRTDNRVENLEWCTQKENCQHAVKNGHAANNRGGRHGMSKLTEPDVLEIVSMLKNNSPVKDVAKVFCVSAQCIYDIRSGKRWGHLTKNSINNDLLK